MFAFPLTASEFRAAHFEKAPAYWKSVLRSVDFRWTDLDATLDCLEPDERSVQMFNGGLVPQTHYTREVVEMGRPRRRFDAVSFYDLLRNGATMVLNQFEKHSPLTQRLCAEIRRYAGLPGSANTYVSFGGAGSFGKHWDTHDVFAIQLLGRKRWILFTPTFPLPLSQQQSEGAQREASGVPVMDVVLEPGDVLYVPRGWWHAVIPFAEGSCHVSVGTYATTERDYLMWVCSQFLAQQLPARRAFQPDVDDRAALSEVLRRFHDAALDTSVRHGFDTELRMRERHHGAVGLALHMLASPLDGAATLRLTMSHATALTGFRLFINGVAHELDPIARAVIDALSAAPSMTFDALSQRLDRVPRDILGATALNLARHEALSIEVPHDTLHRVGFS